VNETPVPDAAVQIVTDMLPYSAMTTDGTHIAARQVVTGLARAGWLHDPAEMDAARARIAELETAVAEYREVCVMAGTHRERMGALVRMYAALDGVPVAEAEEAE
jgi:hypothetical protein